MVLQNYMFIFFIQHAKAGGWRRRRQADVIQRLASGGLGGARGVKRWHPPCLRMFVAEE